MRTTRSRSPRIAPLPVHLPVSVPWASTLALTVPPTSIASPTNRPTHARSAMSASSSADRLARIQRHAALRVHGEHGRSRAVDHAHLLGGQGQSGIQAAGAGRGRRRGQVQRQRRQSQRHGRIARDQQVAVAAGDAGRAGQTAIELQVPGHIERDAALGFGHHGVDPLGALVQPGGGLGVDGGDHLPRHGRRDHQVVRLAGGFPARAAAARTLGPAPGVPCPAASGRAWWRRPATAIAARPPRAGRPRTAAARRRPRSRPTPH